MYELETPFDTPQNCDDYAEVCVICGDEVPGSATFCDICSEEAMYAAERQYSYGE